MSGTPKPSVIAELASAIHAMTVAQRCRSLSQGRRVDGRGRPGHHGWAGGGWGGGMA